MDEQKQANFHISVLLRKQLTPGANNQPSVIAKIHSTICLSTLELQKQCTAQLAMQEAMRIPLPLTWPPSPKIAICIC